MPVKRNEQVAGNGGGDAVSAEYLNIPLGEIVIDAQIRSEIDIEDKLFQSLKASAGLERDGADHLDADGEGLPAHRRGATAARVI